MTFTALIFMKLILNGTTRGPEFHLTGEENMDSTGIYIHLIL
jgi:hypothetical protein